MPGIIYVSTSSKKRKPKHRSAEHARKSRELAESWDKLLASHPGPNFSRGKAATEEPRVKRVIPITQPVRRVEEVKPAITVKSHPAMPGSCGKSISKPVYEGEMLKRELAAQRVTLDLQRRVAPYTNKGGYVYFSDDMVEDMKAGGGRRRS